MMTLVPVDDPVDAFLAHYASQYYDPQKAHEYYIQNRQLKGRQSTSGLSETQKEGWSYAKNQIAVAKKTDLASAAEAEKQALQQLHANATARRNEIASKLKDLFASLSDQQTSGNQAIEDEKNGKLDDLASRMKAQADQISADAVNKIKALPPIPEGVSDKRRAFLSAQRAAAAATIRGSANTELQKVIDAGRTESATIATDAQSKQAALSTSTQTQKQTASTGATADRAQAATDLKGALAKASADYKARRAELSAEYDTKAQQEYDAIKKNLPSAPAKAKSTGKSKSGSSTPKKNSKFFVV